MGSSETLRVIADDIAGKAKQPYKLDRNGVCFAILRLDGCSRVVPLLFDLLGSDAAWQDVELFAFFKAKSPGPQKARKTRGMIPQSTELQLVHMILREYIEPLLDLYSSKK